MSFFGLEDGRRELARWPVTAIELAWR
jgi:hypothetical protein